MADRNSLVASGALVGAQGGAKPYNRPMQPGRTFWSTLGFYTSPLKAKEGVGGRRAIRNARPVIGEKANDTNYTTFSHPLRLGSGVKHPEQGWDAIDDVKTKPPDQQQLIFAREELKDGWTPSDYNPTSLGVQRASRRNPHLNAYRGKTHAKYLPLDLPFKILPYGILGDLAFKLEPNLSNPNFR
ncbi:uncharacterized protein EI90DRAFT_3021227 [Cantharellus anzutake]|uniref:uncharacterized protein n=1 Tax=Cantharellus anzutake TaxID=1750568 RepID=UPI001906552C|nr:uncharacterized protein EI90DRAFT_3021227 [Cantharellus anzutake]KAF8318074.1 hypothetical protein EI90DRAFT_3021227 [Cantharellus anzutake]